MHKIGQLKYRPLNKSPKQINRQYKKYGDMRYMIIAGNIEQTEEIEEIVKISIVAQRFKFIGEKA